MNRYFKCIVFLSLLLSGCQAGEHLGPLQVDDTHSWYPLGLHLATLPDPHRDMTIGEVIAADQQGLFIPSTSSRSTMGWRLQVVWVRLHLRTQMTHNSTWLLEIKPPYIDRLDAYIPQPDGSLALWQTGDQMPFAAREIPFRTFLFSLQLPAQAEQTVYVRVEHTGQLVLDYTLWATGFFGAYQAQDLFFQGIFYGTLLVVLVYNSVLLFSLHARERLYVYLSLVMASSILMYFIADGLGYWLLWPDATWFNDVARTVLWPLASASILLLTSELMDLRARWPRLQQLVKITALGWGGLAIAFVLIRSLWVFVLIGVFSLIHGVLLIIIGILAAVRGWQSPWHYRVVWGIFLGLSVWGLLNEVAGATFYNASMILISRFALLLAVGMTTLAVRGRYDRAWQLQAEAQARAVSAAQRTETVVREQNERLAQRVDQLADELSTFLYTTILVSQVHDWQQILQPALERMQRTLQAQALCVHLVDAKQAGLVLAAQQGFPVGEQAGQPLDLFDPGWNFARHSASDQVWLPALDIPGYAHRLSVLMKAQDMTLGVLSCYRQADAPFTADQSAVAAALGEYLAAAIENQRLRQDAEVGAVNEERQRMGRDLHDSLNQSIYSLALLARAGQNALEEGDSTGLAGHLQDIEAHAFLALREMRILLYSLRPPELEARGLAGALEERFQMVEQRVGLQAEVWVDENLQLSQASEIEVYRIAIEALNNTVKHAQAQQVSVRLERQAERGVLTIRDDGVGDAAQMPGSMGIENMRQRAAALHGDFEITTPEDGGTLVRVTFPL